MFRFKRRKILPLFLQKRMTVAELARRAGVANQTAQRAVEGKKVSAVVIGKIAAALNIEEPSELLEEEISMTQEKTIVKEIKGATREELQAAINAAIAEAESANLVLTNCVITAPDKNGEHSELLIFKTTEAHDDSK